MKATIFGSSWCTYCIRAKVVLEQSGIAYEYVDIDTEEGLEKLGEAFPESFPKSIPQVFLDGTYIGGFAELQEYLVENSLV